MRKLTWVIVIVLAVILVVAVVAIPLVLLPIARHMPFYGYRGMMGPWMMGGYRFLGVIPGLLWGALLVGGIVWLVVWAGRGMGRTMPPAAETPLDILKRRYASGEITKEQFEAMKRDLGL